ncbi:AzlD domain-containing protein [Vibrio palustris]|uniref:Branched-chain amino acid transport protein (AzlD) n=1 Tax=Vibrio palustris TaxID=1918946 RepID=A0A1R4B674_9VIBR|nr:AzlD domain-containing protein [Vibrio palustris]SJL84424.1 Branched-chain amino acid transport protein (AzlD) [Vibrio palustris]
MTMLSIIAMAALVFLSRYIFLEPSLPIKLRPGIQRLLAYSGPAVLTALWGPIVFTHENTLWLKADNPYLWSACVAVLLAWKTKNVLLTTVISMGMFLVLHLMVFN